MIIRQEKIFPSKILLGKELMEIGKIISIKIKVFSFKIYYIIIFIFYYLGFLKFFSPKTPIFVKYPNLGHVLQGI